MTDRASGSEGQPLVLSALCGMALAFALHWNTERIDPESASAIGRYINDDFCLAIVAAALAALVYAALQALGLRAIRRAFEQGTISPLTAYATGYGKQPAAAYAERLAIHTDATHRSMDVSDLWDSNFARRLAPLGYAVWALPLLGFIGTVVGISGSIGGLASILDQAGRETAMQEVLASLRFAFDTTFVGLIGVLPVMAGVVMLRGAGDRVRRVLVERALVPKSEEIAS